MLLVGVLDKVGTFGMIRLCLPLFPDASRWFTPVVLVLAYYRCPQLCTLVLNGLLDGLKGVAYRTGEEVEVVTEDICGLISRSPYPRTEA